MNENSQERNAARVLSNLASSYANRYTENPYMFPKGEGRFRNRNDMVGNLLRPCTKRVLYWHGAAPFSWEEASHDHVEQQILHA